MTFGESHVEVDGVRLRYLEAGQGAPLVHLQEAGELRLAAAHDLLCRHARVLAFAMPSHAPELASTLVRASDGLGLDTFNLMATSLGATTALRLALLAPTRVRALVLESPTIRSQDRDADLERRLTEVATPTLVLCGTMDDVAVAAAGRAYMERMPRCHLVFVYDAAHAISSERPEAFAEVVGDFLERREAFVISRAATVIHP